MGVVKFVAKISWNFFFLLLMMVFDDLELKTFALWNLSVYFVISFITFKLHLKSPSKN